MDVPKQLPARPSLEQYKKQAKELVKAASPATLKRCGASGRSIHGSANCPKRFSRRRKLDQVRVWPMRNSSSPASTDSRVGRNLQGTSRPSSRDARPSRNSKLAVDAVVTGDVAALERLLRENPELVRARSTREHRATLLHYVAANGVEDYRQKTPRNAVEIAKTPARSRRRSRRSVATRLRPRHRPGASGDQLPSGTRRRANSTAPVAARPRRLD